MTRDKAIRKKALSKKSAPKKARRLRAAKKPLTKKDLAKKDLAKKSVAKKPPTRTQYAALPWRLHDGSLEIMLVSSRETRRWIIPKGWPMAGRTGSASAAIEALEEAGLLGVVSSDPIGHFHYAKRLANGRHEPCRVDVFDLRVVRQRGTWLEKDQRMTQWFAAEEAQALASDPELGELIAAFIARQA